MPGEPEKRPAKKPTTKKTAPKRATAKKADADRASAKPPADANPEDATQSRAWRRSVRGAQRMVGDDSRLRDLSQRAGEKLNEEQLGRLGELIADVRTLIRLVRAYARNEYRLVSTDNLILIVAGLIYLVSPIDFIPDFLPLGFLDDVAVLRLVLKMVAEEVRRFKAWEVQRKSSDTPTP